MWWVILGLAVLTFLFGWVLVRLILHLSDLRGLPRDTWHE